MGSAARITADIQVAANVILNAILPVLGQRRGVENGHRDRASCRDSARFCSDDDFLQLLFCGSAAPVVTGFAITTSSGRHPDHGGFRNASGWHP